MATQYVSANALAVLREMECDSNRTRITSGQLDRSLYEEINEVLVRLGGKWKGGRTKAHLFPYDPRPLLAAVLVTGEMPPKNPWAFFPTPQPLVDSVMQSPLFDKIQDGDVVLEPSAGFGALALGMRKRLAHRQVQIDCCEILSINQQVLCDKGFQVVHDDFLTYQPEKRYRAIVMNPPFSIEKDKLAYITHILYAWDLLADGGFLIAFAPAGYTFRSDKKSYDFLSFVLMHGHWEELPPRSFHESGTDSSITLITLEKQDQSWRYQPYNGCPSWFCWDLALLADNGDDEFYRVQQHIIEQLNSGDLCSNPKLPAWSRTREAIHSYYQRVIEYTRKNSHQHVDIRPQDWPFLERRFMMQWDDTWEADDNPRGTSGPEVPIIVEAAREAMMPEEIPAPIDHEAGTSEPVIPVEAAKQMVSPSCLAGTPLYSPLPCDVPLSYEQIIALYEEISAQPRDRYPALPWYMESLVGTTWRNIHTGQAQTIHHLGMNRFGKPILCAVPMNPPQTFGQDQEIIGFWSGVRYIVEHWVCVDQQSQEAQLCWFGVELAWLSRQVTFCEDKIAEYRWDITNRNLQKRIQREYQLQLREAELRMREFADRYYLSIPLEVLNSGLISSKQAPAQMVMF